MQKTKREGNKLNFYFLRPASQRILLRSCHAKQRVRHMYMAFVRVYIFGLDTYLHNDTFGHMILRK